MDFDAALTGSADNGLFGLPFTEQESDLVILPVPWEATTSYGSGASLGPQAVLEASPQLDLFDLETGDIYKRGIYMRPISESLLKSNEAAKEKAQKVIELMTSREDEARAIADLQKEVNTLSEEMVSLVYQQSKDLLKQGKLVGVLGGDHSTPLGLIKAIGEEYEEFSVLHVDAHADLRTSYQGFTHSHASIMDNVMQLAKAPKKLIQVGIRDFCQEEYDKIEGSGGRMKAYFDQRLNEELHRGTSWMKVCHQIIGELPEKVYVSFDIDGLSPAFCPNTGTPVPGGLDVAQAFTLLHELTRSGRKIVGFDLCEVAPDPEGRNEWDGNVGARLLYKLSCLTLKTNQ